MSRWMEWAPYVPVAQRRANARREMEKLRKAGTDVQPVVIEGRKIANTFWGEAWCNHLEQFSDFANRLPRGRTYVRNGSVCHLDIAPGTVTARVSGSELYKVTVKIMILSGTKWKDLKERCAGRIGSLLELLQGRLSDEVMKIVTDPEQGLFPLPGEIHFACSCPDVASMCKHVAAVLYGVGARLDTKPELLFLLRGVDHLQLVSSDAAKVVTAKGARSGRKKLAAAELTEVFGVDVAAPAEASAEPAPAAAAKGTRKPRAKKAVAAEPVAAKPGRKPGRKAAKSSAKKKPAVKRARKPQAE